MKYSCYQQSFVILLASLLGCWLRNVLLNKKKLEIIVFKNKLLLVSLLHLAGLCEKSYTILALFDGF